MKFPMSAFFRRRPERWRKTSIFSYKNFPGSKFSVSRMRIGMSRLPGITSGSILFLRTQTFPRFIASDVFSLPSKNLFSHLIYAIFA